MKKELITYSIALIVVIVFGIIGKINYFLPLIFGIIYVVYLYVSVKFAGTFDVIDDGLKHVET